MLLVAVLSQRFGNLRSGYIMCHGDLDQRGEPGCTGAQSTAVDPVHV